MPVPPSNVRLLGGTTQRLQSLPRLPRNTFQAPPVTDS
jgi:hypothetical protein